MRSASVPMPFDGQAQVRGDMGGRGPQLSSANNQCLSGLRSDDAKEELWEKRQ